MGLTGRVEVVRPKKSRKAFTSYLLLHWTLEKTMQRKVKLKWRAMYAHTTRQCAGKLRRFTCQRMKLLAEMTREIRAQILNDYQLT